MARTKLGLSRRLMLIQGSLTLAVATVVSVAVWLVASDQLLERNRAMALARGAVNAQSLALDLTENVTVEDGMGRLPHGSGTNLVLLREGAWHATGELPGPELRARLSELVDAGDALARRVDTGGPERLAVAVPLPEIDASYFELSGVSGVDGTLRVLALSLALGAIAFTGTAVGLGAVAGRVAMRPVAELSRAARAAARGETDVRLDAEDDPDLGQLARTFNASAEALAQRVVADARFAGDVSHELRTPLTTMLSSMYVIDARRDELSPQLRDAAGLLSAELERFRRLVVDLLEISRADGSTELDLEPVRVGEAVRRAADAAAGRAVTQVTDDADDVVLAVDRRRLERVVANLVENAERHGGGCRGVSVTAGDGGVRISVEDAGPGVPAGRRERIFERFVSSGTPASAGSGLGLAIVARHVRAHGGRVEVMDRIGGGARFVVWLPAHSRAERYSTSVARPNPVPPDDV